MFVWHHNSQLLFNSTTYCYFLSSNPFSLKDSWLFNNIFIFRNSCIFCTIACEVKLWLLCPFLFFVKCYFSSLLHLFSSWYQVSEKTFKPTTQPTGYEKGWVHFIPSLHIFTKNPCLASIFSSFFMLIFTICK